MDIPTLTLPGPFVVLQGMEGELAQRIRELEKRLQELEQELSAGASER